MSAFEQDRYRGVRLTKGAGAGLVWIPGVRFSTGSIELDVRGKCLSAAEKRSTRPRRGVEADGFGESRSVSGVRRCTVDASSVALAQQFEPANDCQRILHSRRSAALGVARTSKIVTAAVDYSR